jgi:CDP-diacylglycerol--serine O-phosphatidyltransferase
MTHRLGIADLITLGNALAGAGAVLIVAAGRDIGPGLRLRVMALLLVVATVLDVVDGWAARRWGGTSLGPPLDALADATSFGLAPALAVAAYVLAAPAGTEVRVGFAAAVLAYVAAALVRLAAFMADPGGKDRFVGLPTTAAAVLALDVAFLTDSPLLAGVGLVLIAALMVSGLRYPMQRSRVVATWSAFGWGFGLIGILGIIDVRIPAVASLVAFVVVVPCGMLRSEDDPSAGAEPLAGVD